MSMISSVRDYIKTYTGLKLGAPLWVGFLGPDPTQYAIIPIPGSRIVERYINDGSSREYTFALESTASTADDAERLDINEFFEMFADWLEAQSIAGVFPVMTAKQSPIKIEATGWGYLFQEGQSLTGIYQIQAKFTYEQQP